MAEKGNIDKIIQAKPEADKTDNNYRKSRMATRSPFKNSYFGLHIPDSITNTKSFY